MENSAKALWEKARAPGEFVARIVTIVAVLYALSLVTDGILAHVYIHVDHYWWAYRVWHAWWWLIGPLSLAGIGWPFRRRVLGGGLWAVGTTGLSFIGWTAGMVLFIDLFYRVSQRVGFLAGSVLSCTAVLLLGLGSVAVGRLVNQVRSRLSR
jgi:hypothetical protein